MQIIFTNQVPKIYWDELQAWLTIYAAGKYYYNVLIYCKVSYMYYTLSYIQIDHLKRTAVIVNNLQTNCK